MLIYWSHALWWLNCSHRVAPRVLTARKGVRGRLKSNIIRLQREAVQDQDGRGDLKFQFRASTKAARGKDSGEAPSSFLSAHTWMAGVAQR
jgi:hypothetical protein